MKTIGFIGAGKMAQALAGGIANDFPDVDFVVSDPNEAALADFSTAVGGRAKTLANNRDVFEASETVVLATKPQHAESALEGVAQVSQRPLVVSIMAGVTIAKIATLTGSQRVIRVMPNTPCLIGQGASGLSAGKAVSPEDRELAKRLFSAVGKVVEVSEDLIDAVTGVSGSGPAYVFRFIEALIEGGTAVGLTSSVAAELALQTVIGAARLIEQTGEEPAALRDRVTSPGGTTLAALNSLESDGFADAIKAAVAAATDRSKELGA